MRNAQKIRDLPNWALCMLAVCVACVYVTEKLSPCRLSNISHVGEVSALMLLFYECLSLTPDVSDP